MVCFQIVIGGGCGGAFAACIAQEQSRENQARSWSDGLNPDRCIKKTCEEYFLCDLLKASHKYAHSGTYYQRSQYKARHSPAGRETEKEFF